MLDTRASRMRKHNAGAIQQDVGYSCLADAETSHVRAVLRAARVENQARKFKQSKRLHIYELVLYHNVVRKNASKESLSKSMNFENCISGPV
jgi:hypothetical protein